MLKLISPRKKENAFIVIEIRDTGIGIPEEDLDNKIWKPLNVRAD